ncbi:serine/threonine-protein kinase 10-like isoform X3 [Homarus americanus]|uniref:serine/threonine-protein kinase 10-like isoform X3 n=1 Tax=Homarus americanus TaxID=6706 RepID=UPI001C440572|nr:serine/threonine-protein kinase 10-like isoform X3 [Homarus americanus]
MPLISKFKDIFKGGSSAKKKKHFHNVRLDNPEEFWDIIGELGDGAYGKVYKAVHKETKQLAALKQVALEEEEDLETFMIEIDILSECKHENIVELLEAYHFTGKLWMYLEYCDGGAMDSIMADLYRPLTEPQIAYVCKYLVEALVYIHDQKVIHRDLKAGNVLLTMEGGVKLADFGVSAKNKNTYDKRGTFIGTPYWLAPEVILCETFIDAKYDYKADVWSLGISLIEFAQMDPPNHEVSPVRVMLKIQKSDPPKLNYPSKYSKEFNDFISKCLVKDPSLRPTAVELLKHPFISKDLDVKPIRDLLLEYKAEVVDEEVDEDGDDQRFSRISEDDPSHEDTFSVTPNAISKENKPPSPGKDENEVVAPDSGERRKGPAPPPPVSGSPASVSSTPSKKGPAPAVPASTTPSKPRAPSPVDVPSDDLVGESGVSSPPSSNASKQVTSTPSGKGPAPKPVSISESPVLKEKQSPTISKTDIPCTENLPSVPSEKEESEKQSSVPHSSEKAEKSILDERMEVDEKPKIESDTQEPKNKSNVDVVDTNQASISVSVEEGKNMPSYAQNVAEVITRAQPNEVENPQIAETSVSLKVVVDLDEEETRKATTLVVDDTELKTLVSTSPPVSPVTTVALSTPDSSTVVSPQSQVTHMSGQATNEPEPPAVPVRPASASLSPSSSEAVIASIGSDATVIVRTPTPTPPEPSQGQPPVKKESVVTYSGPAIVDKNSKDEVETPSSPEVQDSISHPPTSTSPSLSEAEEQAVQILESAIASVGDTVSSKSSQEDGEDSNVTLASTSVILTPEKEKKLDTVVLSDQVVAADQVKAPDSSAKDKDEGITEVQVIPNDGHKLDESEVVISNSSILHDGMDTQPDPNAASKSRYEITLEETAQVEEIPPSVLSANDTTHISVVAVDDLSEAASSSKDTPSSQKDSLVSSKTPPPAPVDQKTTTTRSPVQSEQDHQGHLETSSNISNISNLSGGTTSTGRSVSSAEEENRPTMSLLIEGTTVSATDVDDDEVFDHSENNESKTAKESSANKPALVRELTIGSEVSVESGVSAGSTVSTPSHQTDYSQQSTPVANSPVTKILPNGIGKDAHRLERSEWDNVSTTSSERENRHRERDDESLDEVVLRRPQQADLSDVTIQPLEKNREGRNARATKQENDLLALRKKTRKRTRKFVVDGVVVTTRQVFYEDEGMGTGHFSRKQELRELKILQKIEQKQFQELAVKANFAKAEQEKKFDLERQQLLRGYDTEIEALNRQQKQQVEKAEALQEVELKNASKKIRAEQERELKAFRESLKTELKLLKQEVDLLPKDKRKEAFKSHKERLDVDQSEREKSFLEKLHETHEVSLKRLGDDHRERIALLERQFLQQKHQFLRSRESALWEMEERHLHEKHQLSKRQLKDIFFLQRHQMLLRHDKELEQVKRVNQHMEEELIKRQQIEKRQLPKRIRQEMKARELMFRESMRISTSHLPDSHEDEKNKLKKFQENEKRRYEAEKKRAEQKHQRKLEELQAASEYTVKELEQLQNEKRKMLMEHETNKLKSQDEEYQREVREWKENLKPRKQRTHLDYQKLEEEFEKQLNEQEQFYGAYLCRGLGSSVTPSQSTSSLARSNTS